MAEKILCSLGGMLHPTVSFACSSTSWRVCIIKAQCLLQTTRTSRWFLSDLKENYEFSGKLWPITKCLGSTIVFIVFKFLVLGQASRYVSKNTHYGSGMPQISSIKVPISTLNLVYSFIK